MRAVLAVATVQRGKLGWLKKWNQAKRGDFCALKAGETRKNRSQVRFPRRKLAIPLNGDAKLVLTSPGKHATLKNLLVLIVGMPCHIMYVCGSRGQFACKENGFNIGRSVKNIHVG